MLPEPVIKEHEGFLVVRDDLIPGGTKRRALGELLRTIEAKEFVYPGTAYGYGALALAHAGADLGIPVRLFFAKREKKNWTPMMKEAAAQGAKINLVPMGFMNVVVARAREYCERKSGAYLLPLGFDMPEFRRAFVKVAENLDLKPREVWCAAGTGTLSRALQEAWPSAEHHAVIVCRKSASTGNAERHSISLPFDRAARHLPPFPSAANYDAKVWEVMKRHARPGALLWNVGA
jgi:cysteine synthase